MTNRKPSSSRHGRFPQTDWSHLERLKSAEANEKPPLIDVVAKGYWAPIYQYLLGRTRNPAEAQDLVQDFFAFALANNLFSKADRSRGKFRSFILVSLNNFAANERRKKTASKRKPEEYTSNIDELNAGYIIPEALIHNDNPELAFHKAWMRQVVRNTLRQLEQECTNTAKTSHFALFRSRVILPEMEDQVPPPLEKQAEELGLTYKEAANQIISAKRAFLRLLALEIRSYCRNQQEAVQEHREVLKALTL